MSRADANIDKEIARRTIKSFTVFFVLIAIAIAAWLWLRRQPKEMGAEKPIRSVLNFNEGLFSAIFSSNRLAKTYPLSAAVKNVRVNGKAGMSENFDPASWVLQVAKLNGDTLRIPIGEIKAMPKTEIIFDFKCIEGWNQVTHWGGVKFIDFMKKYGLTEEAALKHTGLVTPDNGYYVGLDMPSMMHPQTLLCYEMNGQPLPLNQGFPLRLIIPVKYGVKHLKRIGTIFFSNERPKDYWYERGYDYYTGH